MSSDPHGPPDLAAAAQLKHNQLSASLLSAISKKDAGAFESLYDHYHRPLFAVILGIVKDSSTADDILQVSFLKIWDRAHLYDPSRGRPISWLVSIARNTSLDHLRSKGRRENAQRSAKEEEAPALVPRSSEAMEIIFGEETAALIKKGLDDLHPDQRTALNLAYFEGFSQTEIAEKLGHPLGTVKGRIRRGLASLRILLEPKIGERHQ